MRCSTINLFHDKKTTTAKKYTDLLQQKRILPPEPGQASPILFSVLFAEICKKNVSYSMTILVTIYFSRILQIVQELDELSFLQLLTVATVAKQLQSGLQYTIWTFAYSAQLWPICRQPLVSPILVILCSCSNLETSHLKPLLIRV